MRKLLVVGLLAACATPLLAQGAPMSQPMGQPTARPMMMAKTMNRVEVQTRVQTQFAKRDANRDGFLTTDELAMRGKGRMAMRRGGAMRQGGAMGPAMRDPNVAFDRLDANRDGSISRDEFARNRVIQIEKRVVMNQPGQPGAMGMNRGGMRGMHRGGGGKMGAAMLKMADANRDGRVTLAEATAGALRHFDMMDTNRDGQVTPQERAAGRAQMRQMRRAS